jgi:glycosyltransferase involved in cell wall biosynthesis
VGGGHSKSYENTAGVTVRGFVEDITEVYANAGLYVQPSRIDPFPVTVLEALRAGIPTVVTESTGSRSEIKKLDDRLIASTTSEGLSECVNWFFDCEMGLKQELSDNAKEYGKEFNSRHRRQQFREKFEKLVAEIER